MNFEWIDLNQDSDLGSFFLAVQKLHGVIRLVDLVADEDASYFKIDKLFVEPGLSLTYVPPEQSVDEWPESTSLLKALKAHSHLVVLGDPGSGKSTLVSWLSTRFGTPMSNLFRTTVGDLVPIPIILREFDLSQVHSWNDLIELWRHRPEYCYDEDQIGVKPGPILSKAKIQTLLESGQAIVMLDGIDEVSTPEQRQRVLGFVHAAQKDYRYVRWVFTSRIVGYEEAPFYSRKIKAMMNARKSGVMDYDDDLAMSDLSAYGHTRPIGSDNWRGQVSVRLSVEELGVNSRISPTVDDINKDPDYGQFYLLPFDDRKVGQFAEQWYEAREPVKSKAMEKAEKFLSDAKLHPHIAEIIRNPILLTLVVFIHMRDVRLPDGRGQAYERIAKLFLERIPLQKRLLDVPYRLEVKMRWLGRVALQMQAMRTNDDHGALLISEENLTQIMLEAMRLDDSAVKEADAVRFREHIARRAGLLLPRSGNEYAFVHLSFQEFFAAWSIGEMVDDREFEAGTSEAKDDEREAVWEEARSRELSFGELATVLPLWANSDLWAETLRMVAEVISEKSGKVFMQSCHVLAESHRAPVESHSPGSETKRYREGDVLGLTVQIAHDPMAQLSERVRSRCLCLVNDRLSDNSVEFHNRLLVFSGELGTDSLVREHLRLLDLEESGSSVSLPGSRVSDLSPFSGLTSLQTLEVSGTQVTDLSSLSGLTSLQELYVSDTEVSDLSPLSGLASLQTLVVFGTQVTDLSPLAKLTSLQELYVSDTEVTDLSSLVGLTSLQTLYVNNTQVSDLSPLSKLKDLQTLVVYGTQVTDLSPLSELTSLQMLNLYNTQVTDLSPLSGLTSLQTLYVNNTEVTDLSPLSGLTSLQTLYVNNTKVTNLSHLADLTSLQMLNLNNTQVTELSPIAGLTKLNMLIVTPNQFSDDDLKPFRDRGVHLNVL